MVSLDSNSCGTERDVMLLLISSRHEAFGSSRAFAIRLPHNPVTPSVRSSDESMTDTDGGSNQPVHLIRDRFKESLGAADDLLNAARALLDANWARTYTRPSPELYPHQWSWDTAFIAMGRAWDEHARAREELETLFGAQWRTGMLPSIVFDTTAPPGSYFPGPEVWQAERAAAAPRGRPTSGITQPPIHARAALEVHRRAGPEERAASLAWLQRLYPRLVAQHRYLATSRDPTGTGLAAIVHPWESGLDDSPAWDLDFGRIEVPASMPPPRRRDLGYVVASERPTDAEYARFLYLVELEREVAYDDAQVVASLPFLMADPLFNAIFLWSEHALMTIAELVGADPTPHRAAAQRLHEAMARELWVPERKRFCPWDLTRNEREPEDTIVSFAPILDPELAPEMVAAICDELESPAFHPRQGQANHFIVPTYDEGAPDFDPQRYWRGPIWINTNWLLWQGLRQHGRDQLADEIAASSVELVRRSGFREYFDPLDGSGHGSDQFSWTAALLIDLVRTAGLGQS
jgi:hypothetical protein